MKPQRSELRGIVIAAAIIAAITTAVVARQQNEARLTARLLAGRTLTTADPTPIDYMIQFGAGWLGLVIAGAFASMRSAEEMPKTPWGRILATMAIVGLIIIFISPARWTQFLTFTTASHAFAVLRVSLQGAA